MNWDSEANVPQLCQGGERERRRNEKTKNLDYKCFWFHPSEYPILIHSEPVSNWK